ncbi:manganese efflux pump MntP family protein [Alicyclobacillus fodiniaquatilis]|uniref:Manganese efflux pump MntP family protein n=1 Tax=Alicyclobacillus fodiniaquatilis TaxID=1661150 RepID=A0ABW4JPF4_9BACL
MIQHFQTYLVILMMSVALGMDALSLSISIGLAGIRPKLAVQLCVAVGVFHVLFTLGGVMFGNTIGHYIGHISMWFGSILLIGMGAHMLYVKLFGKSDSSKSVFTSFYTLLLFSASVSIDALSVGFVLGLRSTTYGIASALSFGLASMLMCGFGLFIGRKLSNTIGKLGEVCSAVLLILLGIKFLF